MERDKAPRLEPRGVLEWVGLVVVIAVGLLTVALLIWSLT
jgi:hypothetical protein